MDLETRSCPSVHQQQLGLSARPRPCLRGPNRKSQSFRFSSESHMSFLSPGKRSCL